MTTYRWIFEGSPENRPGMRLKGLILWRVAEKVDAYV
nr:MAG TPA: hypothetical protein [Caudoviricetes sp.]